MKEFAILVRKELWNIYQNAVPKANSRDKTYRETEYFVEHSLESIERC